MLKMTEKTTILPSDIKTPFEEERERMHQQMLSAVSHDLKTPLASIIGSLEIYQRIRESLAEDRKNLLIATALQEAYRLDSFITNILDMARLENGGVLVRKKACDIKTLLSDSCMKISHLLKDVDVKIITPHGDEKIVIITDEALLMRAIVCLLENAVKHAGPNPEICIGYEQRGEMLNISVADNGPGIPDDEKEIIFDKYARISKKDHQNAGTGLGLAICRHIATLLGGSINVSDAPRKGAVFILHLPV